jgi:hypothetical protein
MHLPTRFLGNSLSSTNSARNTTATGLIVLSPADRPSISTPHPLARSLDGSTLQPTLANKLSELWAPMATSTSVARPSFSPKPFPTSTSASRNSTTIASSFASAPSNLPPSTAGRPVPPCTGFQVLPKFDRPRLARQGRFTECYLCRRTDCYLCPRPFTPHLRWGSRRGPSEAPCAQSPRQMPRSRAVWTVSESSGTVFMTAIASSMRTGTMWGG